MSSSFMVLLDSANVGNAQTFTLKIFPMLWTFTLYHIVWNESNKADQAD